MPPSLGTSQSTTMFEVLALATCFLVAGLWIAHSLRNGLARSVLDHFWYFSFLWMFYFPIRGLLIEFDVIALQVPHNWVDDSLAPALLLSLVLWLLTYAGYVSAPAQASTKDPRFEPSATKIVLAVSLATAMYFLATSVWNAGALNVYSGNEQNELRFGAGPYFLLASFYSLVFYVFAAENRVPGAGRSVTRHSLWTWLIVTAIAASVVLNTRRTIAEVGFVILLLWTLRTTGWKQASLAVTLVIATVALGPILQVIRYINFAYLAADPNYLQTQLMAALEPSRFLTILSSAMEGIDHLATFIQKAGVEGVLFGIDGGLSWLYNAILGLVPRSIWVEKPAIYGSVAQQEFLYPWMYASGPAQTTLPLGFAVDFLFGLGIVGAAVLCFVMGRLFRTLSNIMWNPASETGAFAVSIFVFVNMFNVLRGGTGFVQSLVILAVAILACLVLPRQVRLLMGGRPAAGDGRAS